MASSGSDWRIVGVSLRSPKTAEELNPRNGLFSILVRESENTKIRVIGSIARVIPAQGNSQHVLEAMSDPGIRIASLTVTEKARGIDRATGSTITSDHISP